MYYKYIHFLHRPVQYSASSQGRIPAHNREIDSSRPLLRRVTVLTKSIRIVAQFSCSYCEIKGTDGWFSNNLKDPLRMRRFSLDAIAASKITLTEIRRINEGGRGRCYQSSWMTAVNREPMKFHSKPLWLSRVLVAGFHSASQRISPSYVTPFCCTTGTIIVSVSSPLNYLPWYFCRGRFARPNFWSWLTWVRLTFVSWIDDRLECYWRDWFLLKKLLNTISMTTYMMIFHLVFARERICVLKGKREDSFDKFRLFDIIYGRRNYFIW